MTVQENEAIARAEVEKFDSRDLDGLSALFSSNAEVFNVPTGERSRGPQGARNTVQAIITAFPDARCEIINVVAGERNAVAEYWARGTHNGPMVTPGGTLSPTGRKLEMRICDVMDIQGGKITSLRSYWDLYGLMSQLGLVHEPAHP